MIISRTPFRVSFFGGGTDYPQWYRENGGAVLSTTINKYCFITARYLPPFFDYKYRIRYYRTEEKVTVDEIEHPSVRESLKYMNVDAGVEIVHHADLPAQSGLGSSSTFTVGLLHALHTLKHEMPTKRQLAIAAIDVEQERIGETVGSQDQTAAAFGGLNRIEFGGSQHIDVRPVIIRPERLEAFQDHLMLIFTGFSRTASVIAEEQVQQFARHTSGLERTRELVDEATSALISRNGSLDDFGKLLHEQWMIKRGFTSLISNNRLDAIYETGIRAGALGGKLLGAGGGGFMLFFVRPEDQPSLKEALKDLLHVPFRFETSGSQIVYYGHHS